MQNKGAIGLLAILLALVSIYQLSFTWIVNNVKDDAVEYAKGDPIKETTYLDSISSKGVYDFLWIRDYTYRECQDRELNLGLDLKGGMNVILEVSVVDLIQSLSNYSKEETYVKALNLAIKNQEDSQDDFVTLFGQAFDEVAPEGASLASIFNTIDLRDRITFNSTNDDVLKILREETESAIDNSFNILRTRIDRFGVSQPNIQQLGTAGRILVELAGFDVELVSTTSPKNQAFNEATEALESLGFKKDKISKALSECESNDTASLVKEALKFLQSV